METDSIDGHIHQYSMNEDITLKQGGRVNDENRHLASVVLDENFDNFGFMHDTVRN
jgi:hypothetical protein